MKTILSNLKILGLAFILALGISVVSAATWNGPSETPPQDNVDAPINVSINPQEKTGLFRASALHAIDFFKLTDGNEAEGKVLTSDAEGNASWTDNVAGGGLQKGSGNFCVAKQRTYDCPDFAPNAYTCDFGRNCPFSSKRGGGSGHSRHAIWCCSEVDPGATPTDSSDSKW